ncbi:hypothetical protein HOA64_00940 [bacterium]|nr:hypothetical protein [bacterium]MBT6831605.1 hypothetical protein [bacterium]MBT7772928.1 hypothetical protein [bacterium]
MGATDATALSGFTATSVLGALNELRTDTDTNTTNINTNAANIADNAGNISDILTLQPDYMYVGNGSSEISEVAVNSTVIGQLLTNYSAGTGGDSVAATDSILVAIQKLDGNLSTLSQDKILEGNSSVEVIDTGTGSIVLRTDSTANAEVTVTASGLSLSTGATVDTIETTLTDDDTHLPTSGAVYAEIESLQTSTSNYVPYSGATGAVTLGAENLTTTGTIGAGVLDMGSTTDTFNANYTPSGTVVCNSGVEGAIRYFTDTGNNSEGSFWGCAKDSSGAYHWLALSIFSR